MPTWPFSSAYSRASITSNGVGPTYVPIVFSLFADSSSPENYSVLFLFTLELSTPLDSSVLYLHTKSRFIYGVFAAK